MAAPADQVPPVSFGLPSEKHPCHAQSASKIAVSQDAPLHRRLHCGNHVPLDPFSKLRHHATLPGTKESTSATPCSSPKVLGATAEIEVVMDHPALDPEAGARLDVMSGKNCAQASDEPIDVQLTTSCAPSNVHARQSRSHPRMQQASRVQDRSLHTCKCRHALKNVQLVDRSNEKTVTDSHPRERQSYEYKMLCAHILQFHSARMIADVEQKLGREQKKSMHLAPVDEYRPSNTGGHWQAMPYGQTYST